MILVPSKVYPALVVTKGTVLFPSFLCDHLYDCFGVLSVCRLNHSAELSAAAAADVMASGDFQTFFDRSTRIVERALHQFDITKDYATNDDSKDAYVGLCRTRSVNFISESMSPKSPQSTE